MRVKDFTLEQALDVLSRCCDFNNNDDNEKCYDCSYAGQPWCDRDHFEEDLLELLQSIVTEKSQLDNKKAYIQPEVTVTEQPKQQIRLRAEFLATGLPDHCYECKLHNPSDTSCLIDGRTSDWRPFWCPLKVMNTEETENCTDEGYFGWCT